MDCDDLRSFGNSRDGREILDRIVAHLVRYRRDYGESAGIPEEQRISVRHRFCDFPRTNSATGTRAVLDDDRLPELCVQDLCGQTGGKIRRAARRCGYDDLDRL